MSSRPPTEFSTECSALDGTSSALLTRVDPDGRISLSVPTGIVRLSAEQVAELRNQLGQALTVSLRDTRTCQVRS